MRDGMVRDTRVKSMRDSGRIVHLRSLNSRASVVRTSPSKRESSALPMSSMHFRPLVPTKTHGRKSVCFPRSRIFQESILILSSLRSSWMRSIESVPYKLHFQVTIRIRKNGCRLTPMYLVRTESFSNRDLSHLGAFFFHHKSRDLFP